MNEKFAKQALTQACINAVNHNSNAAATLLARIVYLESEAGIESPELAEAKKIAAQLEKEAGSAPVSVPNSELAALQSEIARLKAANAASVPNSELAALRVEIEKLKTPQAPAQAPRAPQ